MKFPVRCKNCHHLAQCLRVNFGWITACSYCFMNEFQSDQIKLGKDEAR